MSDCAGGREVINCREVVHLLKVVNVGQLRRPKVWLQRGSWSSLEAACLGIGKLDQQIGARVVEERLLPLGNGPKWRSTDPVDEGAVKNNSPRCPAGTTAEGT